jgi:hypothetical protein
VTRRIYHTEGWTVGQWQFFQIDGRQLSDTYEGRKLFGFTAYTEDATADQCGEWFNSLEHAMAAAIAEKYTGARGAGGTGVGTAADWFMRMIGADQLVDAGTEGRDTLARVLHSSDGFPPVGPAGFASRIERGLEAQGIVLARQNHR